MFALFERLLKPTVPPVLALPSAGLVSITTGPAASSVTSVLPDGKLGTVNVVKFVAKDVKPQIRIWAEPSTINELPATAIYIQDNGIGIAPEDHIRIFQMLERLHPPKAYEGTGIGLAIARKGIRRMGGHIGVQSELGKGSKFWIELKKAG